MPLTNTQYDEIMRTYEKRQLDRQQLIDERKKELARIDPEFTKIDSRIARSSVATAKQLLSGDTSAQEHLHKKIQHLRQQRTDLLKEYGELSSAGIYLPGLSGYRLYQQSAVSLSETGIH